MPLFANSRPDWRLLSVSLHATQLAVLIVGRSRVRCRTFLEYGPVVLTFRDRSLLVAQHPLAAFKPGSWALVSLVCGTRYGTCSGRVVDRDIHRWIQVEWPWF
jgi:hypothetical protein